MVVMYKVSALSEMVIRLFAHVRMYALPNFLAGRMLVPELVQADATPEKLGAEIERYLKNPGQTESVKSELARIHALLKQNADANAAEAVVRILSRRGQQR